MDPKKVYQAPVEDSTPRSIWAAQIGGLVKERKKKEDPKLRLAEVGVDLTELLGKKRRAE